MHEIVAYSLTNFGEAKAGVPWLEFNPQAESAAAPTSQIGKLRMRRSDDRERFVQELVPAIEEAALAPELWSEILPRLCHALDGSTVHLAAISFARGIEFLKGANFDDSLLDNYLTERTNPSAQVMMVVPPMTIFSRQEHFEDRGWARSDFYNDVMRPQDLWHGAAICLHRDAERLVPFGFMRRSGVGDFNADERKLIAALAPHFRRSMRVVMRLQEMERRVVAAGAALRHMLFGLVVTDRAGRIHSTNRRADALLAEEDGLRIVNGVLRAMRAEESASLARLIREAGGDTRGLALWPPGAMRVSRPSERRPLTVIVSALRSVGVERRVSVLIGDPERAPEAAPELLARLYGLSLREAQVAALLLQGHEPGAAAEMLAMSMNTVRTHIRHIFEKVGVTRLSELVSVLLRGPVALALDEEERPRR